MPPLGAPEHIREECEKSLRRLRVGAIDPYQVHVPDPAVPYEAAGFDSIAFTEHPAPSQKWMAGGGHESFDPLTSRVAACFAARNGLRYGRTKVIMSVGAGYLRSEFLAFGVEFEERKDGRRPTL